MKPHIIKNIPLAIIIALTLSACSSSPSKTKKSYQDIQPVSTKIYSFLRATIGVIYTAILQAIIEATRVQRLPQQ